jgi:GAF domain-containing protein/CheY-like chemotaxis protein
VKNILIVDDEETMLHIARSRFEDCKDQFNVLTARNGREAVRVLESAVIDLVVTDLKMPEMDGIELLAYMSTKFPSIPTIAMSAFCTAEIKGRLEKMGTLRVLDKPVDIDVLFQTVVQRLAPSHEGGVLKGISVCGFIQLIQMEEKTCLLEVQGEGQRRGFLCFGHGDLFDASCGEHQGEPAALEMIGWANVQLYLRDLPRSKTEKRIQKGTMFLIMEGLRLRDEAAKAESPDPEPIAETPGESLMDQLEGALAVSPEDSEPESLEEAPKPESIDWITQVESVGKIFRTISSELRGNDLLQAVFGEMRDIVPFDLAIVMTREKDRPDHLKVIDLMATGTTTIRRGVCYSCQGSILAKVLEQKSSLIVDDTASISDPVEKELFTNNGLQACLLAPLVKDGIAMGILGLTATKPGIFYDVQGPLEWIANGISLAIEQQRLSAELAKKKQALEASRGIGRGLALWSFDIRRILRSSMRTIRGTMNVEVGFLLLKVNNELRVVMAFHIPGRSMRRFWPKIAQGMASDVAARGESIIVNDTQTSPHFPPDFGKETGLETRSALCVPLVLQGKVMGVIEVRNKIDGAFDVGDEELLQSIADSVGMAIEVARLYRKAVRMAEYERGVRHMFEKFVPKEALNEITNGQGTGEAAVGQ